MSPVVSDPADKAATGFAPIAAAGARILILGSLPSRMSLATQQYYGNPRNAFWRIMGDLFDAGPELPYAVRAARLTAHGIAVWDVLKSSVRPGSLDADIVQSTAVANDFDAFFAAQPQLERLCFNGRKAAQLFARLVAKRGSAGIALLEPVTLPSTSPAHAALAYEEKLQQWSTALDSPDKHGRR